MIRHSPTKNPIKPILQLKNLSQKWSRFFNKPEYFFNPKQVLKRLSYNKNENQRINLYQGSEQSPFYVYSKDVIGRSLLTVGVYDLIVAEAMVRILRPQDTFFDVGANIGYFSRLALERGCVVHSFEPHPQIFKSLKENTNTIHPKGQCSLYNVALSDQAGSFDLYIPPHFENNHGIASLEPRPGCEKVKVLTQKLDDISESNIRLIKIDVEGHELSVLQGAKEILKRNQIEFLVFEDFSGPQSPVIQFLEDQGYKTFLLRKTFFGPELSNSHSSLNIPLWEPPNYIATKNQENLQALFSQKGWQFYSKHLNT